MGLDLGWRPALVAAAFLELLTPAFMQEVLMEPFFCAARGLGGAHAGALDVLGVSTLLMHEVSTLYVLGADMYLAESTVGDGGRAPV